MTSLIKIPVRAVAVRTHQQRHVIIASRIGQSKTYYHVVQKRRIREFGTSASKIIVDMKRQFVNARFKSIA